MVANSARVIYPLGWNVPSSYPFKMPALVSVEIALLYQALLFTSEKPLTWFQFAARFSSVSIRK